MPLKYRPNLLVSAIAIPLVCGALAIHITCMVLTDWAVEDVKTLLKALHEEFQDQLGPDIYNEVMNNPRIDGFKLYYGLWEFCAKVPDGNICIDFMEDPLFEKVSDWDMLSFPRKTWLYVCQIICICAATLFGISLVWFIATIIRPRSKVAKPLGLACNTFAAAVVTLVANITFMTQRNTEFAMKSGFITKILKVEAIQVEENYDRIQAVVDDNFENGTLLLVNFVTPVLGVAAGVLFILVKTLDRRYFDRVGYKDRQEGLNLRSSA